MIKKILYVANFLIFVHLVNAESVKRVSDKALYNLTRIISIYKEKTSEYPDSWDKLVAYDEANDVSLSLCRFQLNFEKRYGFIGDSRYIDTYPPEKIIVMALESGAEGDITRSDDSVEKGRWLIVETENRKIETRWYSEEALRAIFSRSGLNLKDYTGRDGKWVNTEELIKNYTIGEQDDERTGGTPDGSVDQDTEILNVKVRETSSSEEAISVPGSHTWPKYLLPVIVFFYLGGLIGFGIFVHRKGAKTKSS